MADDDHEGFERWLGRELRRTIGPIPGPSPRADQAAYRTGARIRPGPAVFVTGRIAAIGIALALGLGAGTAVAGAATGRANPAQWGETVARVVKGCEGAVRSGPGDVSQCVDGVVRRHADDQPVGQMASPRPGSGSLPASSPGGSGGRHSQQPGPSGRPASSARRNDAGNHNGTDHGNPGKNPDNVPPASGARHGS